MTTPEDDTLPPEELPTDPAVPMAPVRCFGCSGETMLLRIVERNADGSVAKALASPCHDCEGTGSVTRAKWARWHALRQ